MPDAKKHRIAGSEH
jgi:hypothetical protein